MLKASASGYQIQVQAVIITADQTSTANFTLLTDTGAVVGTILDDVTTNPVPNAQVQIMQGSIVIDNTLSDASGNFAFENLAPGSYTLNINGTGYQIHVSSVQSTSGGTTSVTIFLQSGPGAVAGIVIDNSTTLTISGVVVDILQGATLISSGVTDTNGNYNISQLTPGSYTIRFTATGYQTLIQGCIIQANMTTIENVELYIEPCACTGTVTDINLNPIAGAQVSIMQGNNVIATVITDANGNYSILGLGTGTYSIQTSSPNYQNNFVGITLTNGETADIDIILEANPGTIQGTITDSLSQPITSVTVSVDILQGNILVAQGLTDANGFYILPNLAPGSYVIQAAASGYQTASQGAIVIAGQVTTVNFTLGSNPGTISGIITDADTSLPIAGVTITVFNGGVSAGSAITAMDGSYTVQGLSAGTYTVTASTSLYQSGLLIVTVAANATTTADIALNSLPGTIIGIVSDANGAVVAGAQVSISINGVVYGSAITGSNGSYQITGLPEGNYIITITAPNFQTTAIGASVGAGQTVTQNVTLQANPGAITGHVFDQTTALSIPGALVQLIQNNIIITSVITDAQGNYSLSNLAAGTYTVRISASGYLTVSSGATVFVNQITVIDAGLSGNAGTITGTVTNASSTPLPNINIQVFDGVIAIAEVTTDINGNYTIPGLAAGTFTVTASGQGFALTAQTTTVLSNQTTTVDFTLDTLQGSISGTVTEGVTGNPLQGATVDLFSGPTLIAVTLTDVNGLYAFSNVAPGTYIIRVTAPNYQIKTDTVIVVDGANTLANEILEPLPGTLTGHIANAYTNQPLANVIVIVFGGEFPVANTQTDSFGNYTVLGLSPGTYTVQFSLNLYATTTQNITITANATTVFNLLLAPVPTGPTNVTQSKVKDKFATQTVYGNLIKWSPSTDIQIIGYKIYRDGVLVGVVPAKQLTFIDGNIDRTSNYSYTVTAVNSLNVESLPVAVTVIAGSCRSAAAF